jgi:hypothetical protein
MIYGIGLEHIELEGHFVKTPSGATPTFRIPHTIEYLSQEAKEDLRIDMLFQYVANYSKKMKHTIIELSKLKLLCKKTKVGKQELEAKSSIYIIGGGRCTTSDPCI